MNHNLDDQDPLPEFETYQRFDGTRDWNIVHVLPESERQKRELDKAREKADGEDWTQVKGKEHLYVNGKGQFSYRPPEPPNPLDGMADIPIPCVVSGFTDMMFYFQAAQQKWKAAVAFDPTTYLLTYADMHIPDADGWIPHKPGDPMPCDQSTKVVVQYEDGDTDMDPGTADEWNWGKDVLLGGSKVIAWKPA